MSVPALAGRVRIHASDESVDPAEIEAMTLAQVVLLERAARARYEADSARSTDSGLRDQPEALTLASLVNATGLHENTLRAARLGSHLALRRPHPTRPLVGCSLPFTPSQRLVSVGQAL